MIALIVVALGAVAAAVGTGALTSRATQLPHVYFAAWGIALFGLAIGLGAATLGYLAGFSSVLFRAMELGAQLIAPLSLCLAMVETAGRRLGARFAMRLAISGLSIIALVILGTDPLNPNVTIGSAWPDPAVVYQIAPLTILGILSLFTAVTAAATIAMTLLRSSRERTPQTESRPLISIACAAFALAMPGLAWLMDKELGFPLPLTPKDIFAGFCTLAAGLIWYAARMAGARNLAQAGPRAAASLRSGEDWDDDRGLPGYGTGARPSFLSYETGEFDEFRPAGSRGGYEDAEYRGRRRTQDDSFYGEPFSDNGYPGLAALAAEHADDEYEDSGSFDSAAFDSAAFDGPYSGQFSQPAHEDDDRARFERPGTGRGGWSGDYDQALADEDPPGRMFGQITIYTLTEGSVEDFDHLTEWVVAQVRAKEPDALVYIAHAVPTAPMQRILYEVYRDRGAHDQHLLRSYVQTYHAEQRQYVLAANVIELDLRHAKVTPLSTFTAISDMLSESGIDITGITKSSPAPFGYQRALPASGRRPYDEQPDYDRPGYDRPGYDRPGYDRPRYDRAGAYERERAPYDHDQFQRGEYDGYDERGEYGYGEPGDPDAEYNDSGYERPYQQGWAEIRGEDSQYRRPAR
jgi:quinol monooxygenase YgiN